MFAMASSFELFDHTADMGFRLRADTLPELLNVALDALYAVIGDLTTKEPTRREPLVIKDEDKSLMLFDFLNHALILFERDRRRIVALHDAVFDPDRLRVDIITAPIDEETATFDREVKAITYHGLELKEVNHDNPPNDYDNQPDYYEASVIVDI